MGFLKPRHERFCRQFMECMNATIAAKAAGYRPASARNAGYRLLRQPRIVDRIIELQQETAATHSRDVDVLLGKLETIYRRAVDDRQLSAAARAVELQAKLAGIAPTGPPNRKQDGTEPDEIQTGAAAAATEGEPADAAGIGDLTTCPPVWPPIVPNIVATECGMASPEAANEQIGPDQQVNLAPEGPAGSPAPVADRG